MTGQHRQDEPDLDAFFAAARDDTPAPDAAVLARVLAQAEVVQDSFNRAPAPSLATRIIGIWRAFGGWPAMSGLTAATLAGVWIGIAPPAAIENVMQVWIGGDAGYVIDAEPVTAFLMAEDLQ